ncbi:MAG: hypothetical protein CFH33_00026 [Alphaproteobacteria bacterium MarineAlpha9_Bin3]|nr:MAG: hypothetical protein CFH33_00026 [Alphaproteobacteria bacterium MarineAlpha9_Bin3]
MLKLVLLYPNEYSNLKKNITIEIPKSSSLFEIVSILENSNIINNKYAFIVYSFLSGKSKSLKAGEYLFNSETTNRDILDKLYKNYVKLYKIIIPECYSNKQIHSLLQKYFPDFKSLDNYEEGDFFPSTYFISKDTKIKNLLEIMKNKANEEYSKIYAEYKGKTNKVLNSQKEVLILASIVEAEAKLSKEKPKIASVFLNRLKIRMKIQSDPTVIYGINKTVYKEKPLQKSDLLISHKWNTYIIYGLPPTPICNVGIESFYAVLYPEKSENLYFVADGNGGHLFSETYKEHLKNIKRVYKK